jgi:hypothetical protein
MNATVKTGYEAYCPNRIRPCGSQLQPESVCLRDLRAVDWKPIARGTSPLHYDVSRDIGVKGYCYFQVE